MTDGMSYEETGKIKTSSKAIRQSFFKDLSTSDLIIGVVKELYKRYDTEVWQIISVLLVIVIIFQVVV